MAGVIDMLYFPIIWGSVYSKNIELSFNLNFGSGVITIWFSRLQLSIEVDMLQHSIWKMPISNDRRLELINTFLKKRRHYVKTQGG